MSSAAASSSSSAGLGASDSSAGPIYHEVSPTVTLVSRVMFGCAVVMVVLAFIFCLVKGSGNSSFYLLACNIVISSFVGIVNTWWYRNGDLGADKYWYVMLVAGVIIFQCLTTDIYVFNAHMPPSPTEPPTTSTTLNPTKPPPPTKASFLY